jgi:hypothetical protein
MNKLTLNEQIIRSLRNYRKRLIGYRFTADEYRALVEECKGLVIEAAKRTR